MDDLVLRDKGSDRLYALQDALFNVVAMTDDTGAVKQRFAYQPYGESEELNPDFTTYTGTDYEWEYRFTGRELDLETGLQLNRERFYHARLGRWINVDPILYRGGLNLFGYVGGMPTRFVDALGLEGWWPDYLQGQEGWCPDYLQGKEGWVPDFWWGPTSPYGQAVAGAGQGCCNTANGVQDCAIGIVNLPVLAANGIYYHGRF